MVMDILARPAQLNVVYTNLTEQLNSMRMKHEADRVIDRNQINADREVDRDKCMAEIAALRNEMLTICNSSGNTAFSQLIKME